MCPSTERSFQLSRRVYQILTLGFLSLVLLQSTHSGQSSFSPMARIAASLQAGSWAEVTTTNIAVLLQSGSDLNILPYAADIAWDPNSRKLLYIGNDHIDGNTSETLRFVVYDDITNSWQNMSVPPWSRPGST